MDARSPEAPPRSPVAAAELVVAGGLLALGSAFVLGPGGVADGPVLCPLRRLTGLECPACGLTRSWVHLAHGDVAASVAAHPFGPVLVAGLVALAVLVVRARRRAGPPPVLEALLRRPGVLAVAALWALWGSVRLAG